MKKIKWKEEDLTKTYIRVLKEKWLLFKLYAGRSGHSVAEACHKAFELYNEWSRKEHGYARE